MTAIPLTFRVGARTIASVERTLTRVSLSLDQVLDGIVPTLPPLVGEGYLVTSLPARAIGQVTPNGLIVFERQRYRRYWTDVAGGHEHWFAGLSRNARSTLRRRAKRLAELSGGALDVRCYHTAAAFAGFHPLARALSAKTYQERSLDAGLPADPESVGQLSMLAADDRLRSWLLFLEGVPIAYLCCTADDDTLVYNYVGHDPAHGDLSPGTVLQAEAMKQLFDDRFARFDFTEGEGQHKRLFASGGVECVDLLLLRPTIVNRTIVAALAAFDRLVAIAKRVAPNPWLTRLAKQVRR